MKPSVDQEKVYQAIRETNSNICIQSTAGSGKTTTILNCLRFVPKFKRSVFLSFSNGIVGSLKSRVPEGVLASTLHALGNRFIFNSYGQKELKEDKYFIKALSLIPKSERDKNTFRDCYRIQDICNFTRMTLTDHNLEDMMEMCEYYSLEWNPELITRSIELLQPEKFISMIDFTDMIYLPLINEGCINQKFDYIFLDEAQDLNKCQRVFIEKLLADKGRLICVYDRYQSIYSFAGSSIDSVDYFEKRPNTLLFTLPVSYRCSKEVVKKAQRVCEQIQAHDLNDEGEVRSGSYLEIQEGDLVVSRTTRPLVALYFLLLERDVKATVVGKDIEKGLSQLAEKCKSYSFEILKSNFQKQIQELTFELKELGIKSITIHPRYINLIEKINVLSLIASKCERAEQLSDKISEIFSESKKSVKLMTLHRAKGLESDRVFMIERYNNESLLPSKYAVKDWEKIQERNLEFVGITRAKNLLVYINVNDI